MKPRMNDDLFALPFHEYMARRTKFAVDKAQQYNYRDLCSPEAITMLQAMWAREYWFKKNEEVTE
jgi:hypothetical protein